MSERHAETCGCIQQKSKRQNIGNHIDPKEKTNTQNIGRTKMSFKHELKYGGNPFVGEKFSPLKARKEEIKEPIDLEPPPTSPQSLVPWNKYEEEENAYFRERVPVRTSNPLKAREEEIKEPIGLDDLEPIDPSSKFADMFNEFLLKGTSLEKKVPLMEKKELPRGWKCIHKSLGGHFFDYSKSGGNLDWSFVGTLEEVKGHIEYNSDAEALEEYVLENSFNIEDVFFTKSSGNDATQGSENLKTDNFVVLGSEKRKTREEMLFEMFVKTDEE